MKGSGTVCPARLPQPQVASRSPQATRLLQAVHVRPEAQLLGATPHGVHHHHLPPIASVRFHEPADAAQAVHVRREAQLLGAAPLRGHHLPPVASTSQQTLHRPCTCVPKRSSSLPPRTGSTITTCHP